MVCEAGTSGSGGTGQVGRKQRVGNLVSGRMQVADIAPHFQHALWAVIF